MIDVDTLVLDFYTYTLVGGGKGTKIDEVVKEMEDALQ